MFNGVAWQHYSCSRLLPNRKAKCGTNLLKFDSWGALTGHSRRQDGETGLPPGEFWRFNVPAVDQGFGAVAAGHATHQMARRAAEELLPLARVGRASFNFDHRSRHRIGLDNRRPFDDLILPKIVPPVDLSASFGIHGGRIYRRGIRPPQ